MYRYFYVGNRSGRGPPKRKFELENAIGDPNLIQTRVSNNNVARVMGKHTETIATIRDLIISLYLVCSAIEGSKPCEN